MSVPSVRDLDVDVFARRGPSAGGGDGPVGATGPSGPPGPVGATGATGYDGYDGATGVTGATGPSGAIGATGASGAAGVSTLPAGGISGQMLAKASNADFDAAWTDPPEFDINVNADGDAVYSTTPVWTGNNWIDGRPIERVVVETTTGPQTNQRNLLYTMPNFAAMIRCDGFCFDTDNFYVPIQFSGGGSNFLGIEISPVGGVYDFHGSALYSNRPLKLIIEYIRNP